MGTKPTAETHPPLDDASKTRRTENIPPRQRILVVDDDAGVRESLAGVLRQEGYSVSLAANGADALATVSRAAADLVILDLNMPVMNGWDTFEKLTFRHPQIPIIIATARANQLFTALGAGADALLEKPLDIPELIKTVRRLLGYPLENHLARLAGRKARFHYVQDRSTRQTEGDREPSSG